MRAEQAWTPGTMANQAGMSRSAFAAAFRMRVGQTPAAYLTHWRIAISQGLLRQGGSVKAVGDQLGYTSASSLSRAFTQATGASPREWLQAQAASSY